MRTEAASNPTCDHFGFSCRQGILPDLSNSDCLPGRAGGTPVGLAAKLVKAGGALQPLRNTQVECVNVLLGGFEPAQLHR